MDSAETNCFEPTRKTALDLFCGSGGVSSGLKSAGFEVVGAVDVDPVACKTYRMNHPEVNLLELDIADVSPEIFAQHLSGGLDVLAVCAPCQPFSSQNRFKHSEDERVSLILNAVPFVEALKPKIIFFENVPGLKRQPVFITLKNQLLDLGYSVGEPFEVDASKLGVPQRRQRMVLFAAQSEGLLNGVEAIEVQDQKTVRDAIGDLPVPKIGRTDDSGSDSLHFARQHQPVTLERMRHIPLDGGSRISLPERLQLECHKNRKQNSFPDTYGRMAWNQAAPTLTTGCTDLTKGRFAHPEQHRAITLREAARLQTFPDSYTFEGNAAQVATQIGNAVPPRMMEVIATTIRGVLTAPVT